MKHKKAAAVAAGLVLALGGAAPAVADVGAEGLATGSPGVLSGNVIQLPLHVPLNLCGNSANLLGLLNPAVGSTCLNG
ncbi:chaplin [Streptomyces sp. NPDC002867]